MYLDSLEFLEEERDAWAPYEALAELTDEQLSVPVAGAHGWSGRQLMGHLVAWQEDALAVATELAVNETSATKARADADWEARRRRHQRRDRCDLGGTADDRGPGALRDDPRPAPRLPDGRPRDPLAQARRPPDASSTTRRPRTTRSTRPDLEAILAAAGR